MQNFIEIPPLLVTEESKTDQILLKAKPGTQMEMALFRFPHLIEMKLDESFDYPIHVRNADPTGRSLPDEVISALKNGAEGIDVLKYDNPLRIFALVNGGFMHATAIKGHTIIIDKNIIINAEDELNNRKKREDPTLLPSLYEILENNNEVDTYLNGAEHKESRESRYMRRLMGDTSKMVFPRGIQFREQLARSYNVLSTVQGKKLRLLSPHATTLGLGREGQRYLKEKITASVKALEYCGWFLHKYYNPGAPLRDGASAGMREFAAVFDTLRKKERESATKQAIRAAFKETGLEYSKTLIPAYLYGALDTAPRDYITDRLKRARGESLKLKTVLPFSSVLKIKENFSLEDAYGAAVDAEYFSRLMTLPRIINDKKVAIITRDIGMVSTWCMCWHAAQKARDSLLR